MSLPANFQCSHCIVLVPFCIIYSLHLIVVFVFCKPFGYQNDPCNCIISRLSYLQGTRGSFNYFPKNALILFCFNMKSAVHVPYADGPAQPPPWNSTPHAATQTLQQVLDPTKIGRV